MRLGGQRPLHEFHKLTRKLFGALLERIEDDMVRTYDTIEISADGVDWENAGLARPSSTWTYLVSDDAFADDGLRNIMLGPSTTSMGVVLMLPILVPWGLWVRWRGRLKGTVEG